MDCEDEDITRMLADIPFSKNGPDVYGVPFQELFDRCGNNWANVPRDWDAPCRINFFNRRTGHAYTTGKIGYQTLEAAFIGNGGKVE